MHGDAASEVNKLPGESGANIISAPTPSSVRGTEGPLRGGDLEKAAKWAENLASALEQKATP